MKRVKFFVLVFFVFIFILSGEKLPPVVRGVYLNPYVCSRQQYLMAVVDSMKEYGLNAVVIDVKADNGIIPFATHDSLLKDATKPVYNIDSLVNFFHENKILLIGRIVTFKDPVRAKLYNGKYAILDKVSGKPWRNDGGAYWVDPYNMDNWDYNIEVAKDVLNRGFDSVQFDYVRFPSDGNVGRCSYPDYLKGYSYSEIIGMFVHYAEYELRDYNADIGVDVFGYLPWLKQIVGIGQDMKIITSQANIVSPMLYPSHFGDRFLLEDGDYFKRTYDIIRGSLDRSRKYLSKGHRVIPYLQAFDYKESKMGRYYIENQINALMSSGNKSYYFWNAGSNYSLLWKAFGRLSRIEPIGRALNYTKFKECLFNETSKHRNKRI